MFRWTADIMDMIFCCAKNLIHVMGKVGRKAGLICMVINSRGRKSRPLYGIEGWPRSRLFLCTILKAMQSGTKVSVRYRRSGRLSGVVVKRGSTVLCIIINNNVLT